MLNEHEAGRLFGLLPGDIRRWVRHKELEGITTSTGILTTEKHLQTFARYHSQAFTRGRKRCAYAKFKLEQLCLDL